MQSFCERERKQSCHGTFNQNAKVPGVIHTICNVWTNCACHSSSITLTPPNPVFLHNLVFHLSKPNMFHSWSCHLCLWANIDTLVTFGPVSSRNKTPGHYATQRHLRSVRLLNLPPPIIFCQFLLPAHCCHPPGFFPCLPPQVQGAKKHSSFSDPSHSPWFPYLAAHLNTLNFCQFPFVQQTQS